MCLAPFLEYESFEGKNQIILILYCQCLAHDRSKINIFKKKGHLPPQKIKKKKERPTHRSFRQIKGNLRQRFFFLPLLPQEAIHNNVIKNSSMESETPSSNPTFTTHHVILGKLLNLTSPPFPHQLNGGCNNMLTEGM